MKVRVLNVIPRYAPIVGGAELQCSTLLRELRKLDRIAADTVVTRRTTDKLPLNEVIDDVLVLRLGSPGLNRWGEYHFYLLAVKELWRLRDTYDVIHGHATGVLGLTLAITGFILKKPVVLKLSTNGELIQGLGAANETLKQFSPKVLARRLMAKTIGKLSVVVVLNEEGAREAKSVGSKRVSKIFNGVDPTLFYPVENDSERERLRRYYGMPIGQPIFVFSGRFVRRKGVALLLDAFKECFEGGEEGFLVLLGTAALQEESVDSAVRGFQKCFPERVLVCPASHSEVADLLRCCDWFVFPSLQEGMPNAVLEALACGLSCILSDIDPHKEIKKTLPLAPIKLFSSGSASELSLAIKGTLNVETKRPTVPFGFFDKYSSERTARSYAELYLTLVGGRAGDFFSQGL